MPLGHVVNGVISEGRKAPYTMVAVVMLLVLSAFYLVPGVYEARALASTLKSVQQQLDEIAYTVKVDALSAKLTALDGQIFDLERERQRYRDGHAGGDLPDAVLEQLEKLKSQRELAEIERLNVLYDRKAALSGRGRR